MNAFEKLLKAQADRSSLLCVGLDTDLNKIPEHLSKKGIAGLLEFNCEIISAVSDYVCGFKINFAFYEQYGAEGIDLLKKTFDYIPNSHFKIADAKRGDIGNTSRAYANAIFDYFRADSATLMPYMGVDSIQPFLEYKDKLNFLVTLSSNPGSFDFQRLVFEDQPLYMHVLNKACKAGNKENIGFVVGATHPEELKNIRDMAKDRFFLIPGIGAQGGSLDDTLNANRNSPCIIAASRSIIYAGKESDFATKASDASKLLKEQIIEIQKRF